MTVRFVCERDASHTLEETAETVSDAVSPTEDSAGYVSYTAEFTDESLEAHTIRYEIPALKDLDVLRLPSSLEIIEEEAFASLDCEAVIIPEGCTAIGPNAFRNCIRLRYVRIPGSVSLTDPTAFSDCSALVLTDRPEEP